MHFLYVFDVAALIYIANDNPNSIGKAWTFKPGSRLSRKPSPTPGMPSGPISHLSSVKLDGQQPGPITADQLHVNRASRGTTPRLHVGSRGKSMAGTGSLVSMSQRGRLRLRGTLVLLCMDRP